MVPPNVHHLTNYLLVLLMSFLLSFPSSCWATNCFRDELSWHEMIKKIHHNPCPRFRWVYPFADVVSRLTISHLINSIYETHSLRIWIASQRDSLKCSCFMVNLILLELISFLRRSILIYLFPQIRFIVSNSPPSAKEFGKAKVKKMSSSELILCTINFMLFNTNTRVKGPQILSRTRKSWIADISWKKAVECDGNILRQLLKSLPFHRINQVIKVAFGVIIWRIDKY